MNRVKIQLSTIQTNLCTCVYVYTSQNNAMTQTSVLLTGFLLAFVSFFHSTFISTLKMNQLADEILVGYSY